MRIAVVQSMVVKVYIERLQRFVLKRDNPLAASLTVNGEGLLLPVKFHKQQCDELADLDTGLQKHLQNAGVSRVSCCLC
jgi:hypothetical protein